MADKTLKFVIEADGSGAVTTFKQVGSSAESELGKAEKDIDGLLQKVDKLGAEPAKILLKSNAEDIALEIVNLIGDLDKLDANDPTIQVKSDQINKLTGDLDQIKAKFNDVSGTPLDLNTGPAVSGLDDVAKSAGSSKSVLANMVGNSVQDLGAVGGVAGSAGVAIGQMGEYMADALADGDALGKVLKNFAMVSGPIAGLAAITFAVQMYTDAQEKARQKTEDLRKSQEQLRQGNEAAFVEELAKQYGTLVNQVSAAGISTNEFLAFVRDGTPIENFTQRLEESGVALEGGEFGANAAAAALGELRTEFVANEAAIDANKQAEDLLAESLGLVRDETGELVPFIETLTGSLSAATEATQIQDEATRILTEAVQAATDAAEDEQKAIEDATNAKRAAADATFALHNAEDDWLDTIEELPATLEEITDSEATQEQRTRDLQRAYIDATNVAAGMADAAVRLADEQAVAAGATLSADEKMRIWNSTMARAARDVDGPVRDSIINYIATVNGIPADKVTEILATDNGTADHVAQEIDHAARPRTARINVVTVGGGGSGSGSSNEKAFGASAFGTGRSVVNNFYITATGGLGSNGAQLGNEIANALKAWEKINGPIFSNQ